MMLRRPRRPQLRTRVLAGVLLITVVALVAFDVAAVTALRGYLVGQTDSRLQTVLSLYRPVNQAVPHAGSEPPRPVTMRSQPPPLASASTGAHLAGPAQARTNWVIAGPRLRLSPPVLGPVLRRVRVRPRAAGIRRRQPRPGSATLPPGLPVTAAGAHVQTVSQRGRGHPAPAAGRAGTHGRRHPRRHHQPRRRQQHRRPARAHPHHRLGGGRPAGRRGRRPGSCAAACGPSRRWPAQADRITAGDLTDRVSPQDPATEVGRLGAALNGMLTRIEASIAEREASQELTRRFFADASHELRTPLASLRANAELYQQGALARRPQVDEAMRRIALEAQRMGGLVDDMLRLARLDQHPDQQHDRSIVTALVHGCAERARIADPQRTWRTQIAAGLVATGDEELLRRAVDNLLANVHAHTPGGTVATITAAARGGTRHRRGQRRRPRRPGRPAPAHLRPVLPRRGAHRAPGPVWGWPSSPRSPPPTTAPPRRCSTTRTGCGSPSRCPRPASHAPPWCPPPASPLARVPAPRCSDAAPGPPESLGYGRGRRASIPSSRQSRPNSNRSSLVSGASGSMPDSITAAMCG